jgi:type IV secretory pathway VirB10-like protein
MHAPAAHTWLHGRLGVVFASRCSFHSRWHFLSPRVIPSFGCAFVAGASGVASFQPLARIYFAICSHAMQHAHIHTSRPRAASHTRAPGLRPSTTIITTTTPPQPSPPPPPPPPPPTTHQQPTPPTGSDLQEESDLRCQGQTRLRGLFTRSRPRRRTASTMTSLQCVHKAHVHLL